MAEASLSEDEIDDLLYFARTGDTSEFDSLRTELIGKLGLEGVEGVRKLLELARDPNTSNGLLHMLAANGIEAILTSLLTALSQPMPQNAPMLAIINTPNSAGNTPLHWAALNGHLNCVKILLENGADPTITNQRGHDAVYEAEINDKKDVVEWVLKEGGEGLEEGVADDGGSNEDDVEEEEEEEDTKAANKNTEHTKKTTELEQAVSEININTTGKEN